MVERNGRKVAIVGFWEVTRDLAFTDPAWADATIWSLNHNHPYIPRWDVWFDIHSPEWSATRGLKPEVWADQERFLKASHGRPVYMQRHYPEYPDSTAYPLEEVVRHLGRRYFTCAVTYMIALALHQGCDEIGLFGADMRGDEEYATQRPATEYWLGRAEGMGVKVYVPPAAGVLNADGVDYGYDEDNSAWVEMHRALTDRYREAVAIKEAALLQAAKATGCREVLGSLLNGGYPDPAGAPPEVRAALEAQLATVSTEYEQAMAQHYGHEGIAQENLEWLRRVGQRRRGGGAL